MRENLNKYGNDDTKQEPSSLSLHPDDAKDKVFTAILKALQELDNKPSSPKELANVIIQSNYVTLGGSTPFATVSSRISQHFKRAAQHKPPRSPLLTRHVNSLHPRKINYSLSTESILPSPTPSESASLPSFSQKIRPQQKSKPKVVQALSLEHDDAPYSRPTGQTTTKNKRQCSQSQGIIYKYDNKSMTKSTPPKRKSQPVAATPSTSASCTSTSSTNPFVSTTLRTIHLTDGADTLMDDKSHSDKDMLNETTVDYFDKVMESINEPTLSFAFSQQQSGIINNTTIDYMRIDDTNSLWTNDTTVGDDCGLVYLPDSSTAHQLSFNIDAPETMPLSELDDYFENDKKSPTTTRPNCLLSSDTAGDHLHEDPLVPFDSKGNDTPTSSQSYSHKHQRRYSWPMFPQQMSDAYKDTVITTQEFHWNTDNYIFSTDSIQGPIPVDKHEHCEDSQRNSTIYDSTHNMISDSEQSTSSYTTRIGDKYEDDDLFFDFNGDVNDECDMPDYHMPTHPLNNSTSMTSLNVHTLSKLLELMHANRADFTTLHQMIINAPELNYLSPIVRQIQSLATYLQKPTVYPVDNCASSLQSSANDSNMPNAQQNSDINAILTQFPVLQLILNKYHAHQNVNVSASQQQPSSTETIMVQTTTLTNPVMYITEIDDIVICVAILPPTCDLPEYRIMRRLDLDYVNGTTLLKAGGIGMESERSVIFSLEKDRLRIRRQNSLLNGTWLPLNRAQHLAATCSIQHRLGSFLDNNIESHFPSPLPVNVVKRQQLKPTSPKTPLLYSRNADNNLEISQTAVSRNVSLAGDSYDGGQRTDGFWSDMAPPNPSLLNWSDIHLGTDLINVQQQTQSSTTPSPTSPPLSNHKGANNGLYEHSDNTTDTDSDIEELRRHVKRGYDTAISEMSGNSSLEALHNQPCRGTKSEDPPTQGNKRQRKQQQNLHCNTTKRITSAYQKNLIAAKTKKAQEPTMVLKSASWHGSVNQQQLLFSVHSTHAHTDEKISATLPPTSLAMTGSTLEEVNELGDIDIGGNGYGDDLW